MTTRTDIDIQQLTRDFVQREVHANVGNMVEYILNQETDNNDAPFTWDDVTNMYPDPTDWTREQCEDWITDQHGTSTLEELMQDYNMQEDYERWNYEDSLIEYIRDNAEAAEPLEWWLVSNWLAEKLAARGEVIIEPDIWGRQGTGQAIYMDGVMQAIALEFSPQPDEEDEQWSNPVANMPERMNPDEYKLYDEGE